MKSNHQTYTRNPANMRHDAPSFQSLRSFTHQNPGETCRVDNAVGVSEFISWRFDHFLPISYEWFALADVSICREPGSNFMSKFTAAQSIFPCSFPMCFNCKLCVSKLHLIQILLHLGSISMIFYVFLTSSPFFTCPALGCRPFSLRQRPAPALLSARGANGIRMP